MKPRPSPLTIIDFALLNLEYNFIQPQSQDLHFDPRKVFNDYDIDIDFGITSNDIIHVVIKAEINRRDKKAPGYSIFAEAACLFEFNKDMEIDEKAKNDIEGFSTVYIALNTLRGFISQITANGPFGRYVLPSIDLNDLISQKKTDNTTSADNVEIKKKKNEKKKIEKK